ncbi:MAG: Gfo/Idh/MocA family oxidoreductase [Spirochaetaceae bacterium]|nr:Gfo/Idh/MocA family oxidoreductase [Spirochaetaceae bacterium]
MIRVAMYGAGSFANSCRIPNLQGIDGVRIVAVCDVDRQAREATAQRFAIPRAYADAGRMLEAEKIDVLYSLVHAADRTDVETRAAAQGVHLFSEKPQALSMKVARAVDAAVCRAGVLSTVGFRERYRPLFCEARRLLAGRRIIHINFLSEGTTGARDSARLRMGAIGSGEERDSFERTGGSGLGWGVHALDCARYISGLDVETAQAFYYHPDGYRQPLSYCYHFRLTGGATMTMTLVDGIGTAPPGNWFTVLYEGGHLALHGYERIERDGVTVFRGEPFDPWAAQDRAFIKAVRTGDPSLVLSDYHDGLSTLAPVLAGWESARRGGQCMDVAAYSDEE